MRNAAAPHRNTPAGFAYVMGATLLWSAVPICLKFAVTALDSYTICWLRFAVGAAILFAAGWGRRSPMRIRRTDLPIILVAAAGIGGNYVFYLRGLQFTTASAGHVVVQFEVISLVILSYLWLKERIGRTKLMGMAVTFTGVFLALWNGEGFRALIKSEFFYGNMLILIAAPLWAVYGIAQKILADRAMSISCSLAYIFGIAAVFTLPAMVAGYEMRGPVTLTVLVSLFILVALSTVGSYLLMGRGFRHLDASTAAIVTCMLPVFTIINARIFLHEHITPAVAAGALLVVAGILLIGREETMGRLRSSANQEGSA